MSRTALKFLLLFAFTTTAGKAMAIPINASLNPLGLLVGYYHAGVEFGLTKNVSAGPVGVYANQKISNFEARTTGLGLRLDYAPDKLYRDGMYYALFAYYGSATVRLTDEGGLYHSASGNVTLAGLSTMIGYGWFWPGGFNLRLGGGLSLVSGSGEATVETSDGTTHAESMNAGGATLVLDLVFAWAFGVPKSRAKAPKKRSKKT